MRNFMLLFEFEAENSLMEKEGWRKEDGNGGEFSDWIVLLWYLSAASIRAKWILTTRETGLYSFNWEASDD